MGFGDSVRLTAFKMEAQVNEKALEIAKDLFTEAVKLTPVSSPEEKKRGELKNNWRSGVNSVNFSYSPNFDITGASSLASIAELDGSIAFLGKDGKVNITNMVPYGFRAEYEGWPSPRWKDSKPYAMMRNALTTTAAKYKGQP